MPAGLQAWDASGNLVADLGDYSTRFVGRYSINFPQNVMIVSQAVPGLTGANSFATIMAGSVVNGGIAQYAAVTKSGGFDIIHLPSSFPPYAQTLTVEVYMFN